MAQRGWTNAFRFFRKLITVAAMALALPGTQLAQKGDAEGTLSSFSGTWTGICQDGNPFVILS
jgi:hypothetical protein